MSSQMERFFRDTSEVSNFIKEELKHHGIDTLEIIEQTKVGIHVNLKDRISQRVHHVKFSKEPFRALGFIFPQYRGEEGDSINLKILEKLSKRDYVYFGFPERIYRIRVEDIPTPYLMRKTKTSETTVSIPFSCMEKFY